MWKYRLSVPFYPFHSFFSLDVCSSGCDSCPAPYSPSAPNVWLFAHESFHCSHNFLFVVSESVRRLLFFIFCCYFFFGDGGGRKRLSLESRTRCGFNFSARFKGKRDSPSPRRWIGMTPRRRRNVWVSGGCVAKGFVI